MKYYAIKRPDGSWIMGKPALSESRTWANTWFVDGGLCAIRRVGGKSWKDAAIAAGYRCVEVSGFVEVEVQDES